MAEAVRFELTNGYKPLPVFKTGAFNRSAKPPQKSGCDSIRSRKIIVLGHNDVPGKLDEDSGKDNPEDPLAHRLEFFFVQIPGLRHLTGILNVFLEIFGHLLRTNAKVGALYNA